MLIANYLKVGLFQSNECGPKCHFLIIFKAISADIY